MKKPAALLPLLLLLLLAFALRLYRLGGQSLWYDETVSAILARKAIPELIAHTARDIHPPGYYLLLHGWRRLAGETEFALAFLSLVFGVLLVAGVYLLGRRLFDRPAALWAAALVALSPYHLWYSQEVRMYTLAAFLGLLTLYFTLQALSPLPPRSRSAELASKPAPLPWLGYTMTAALGLYTLYYFAFLLIPLNLFILAVLIASARSAKAFPGQERKAPPSLLQKGGGPPLPPAGGGRGGASPVWKVSLSYWLLANLGILLLYLPWLAPAWRQATNPPVPPWRSTLPLRTVLLESWTALSLGESVMPGQVWPLLLLVLGLFILGVFAARSTSWPILLPLLVFGPLAIIYLAPFIGLSQGPLYHVRYVFTYSPPFYLSIGLALAWLWGKQRLVALLISLLLFLGAAFSIYEFHTNPLYASDDFRSAVRLLQQKWRPGDAILINAGYAYPGFQYYFSDPVDGYARLTGFDPAAITPNSPHPLVLETGTVNGPPSLGWGDPASDFYAMSEAETVAALETVSQTYPRLWLLRIYDTVADPESLIRVWLAENMTPFEDQVFSGGANMRLQGFLSPRQPPPPPTTPLTLEDRFILRGFTPPAPHYRPGETIDVVLWWEAQAHQPTDPPYALSLKLWDSQGNLAAQTEPDEWPVGNLYFTPAWQPGQVIRYPLRLQLPSAISPGQYWLNVVFYNAQNGLPLQVRETGEQVILLGGLQIVE